MGLSVGDVAPGFSLDGVDGTTGEALEVSLSQHRGTPVVLAFYPADNSPVCTAQLESYTAEVASFDALNAVVLAVSPQSVESHRQFAQARGGFAFPLLSDEDARVGRAYGNIGLLRLYRRSTFVIDPEGRVTWMHRYIGPGLGYKPVDELVAALRAFA
ncbi:MAG: peroxiredoxin [Microthrixaceae bacterium]